MIDLEDLSNSLQELFESSDYIITTGGFFGDIACFTARGKSEAFDILISEEIIDFIPCEEDDSLLELFNLTEVRNLVLYYLNQQNIKINKSGTFIEEYQMQQIAGYYFNISISFTTPQIQIFPGDFAIPILHGEEPAIPDISKAEFIGSFDDSDFKELLDQGLEIPEEDISMSIPLKKSKKIGRNEPCPCGSGIKYKKCCGKMTN